MNGLITSQRANLVRALEHGEIRGVVPRVDSAMDRIEIVQLVDPDSGDVMKAVIKTVRQGGPQERFASEFAAAAGWEQLVPAVGRRSDGSAAIEWRPGATFRQSGIFSGEDLERAFYEIHSAHEPAEQARHAAVLDRQRTQVFDHQLLNWDRNYDNGLQDAHLGMSLIDHANISTTIAGTPRHVSQSFGFTGGTGTSRDATGLVSIRLDPEVVGDLASLDRDRARAAFRQLQTDARPGSVHPAYLDGVFARTDHATETGEIQVRGIMSPEALERIRQNLMPAVNSTTA